MQIIPLKFCKKIDAADISMICRFKRDTKKIWMQQHIVEKKLGFDLQNTESNNWMDWKMLLYV